MKNLETLIQKLCPDGVEFVKLGEVMDIYRGASPRPIQKYLTTEKNGVNWIKIGDVEDNAKYIISTKEKITQEGAAKSRFLHKGDLILSNSMSFGRPYILAIDGCIHDGWISMSGYDGKLLPDFLYHLLRSYNIQKYWRQKASSGTVSNLNADIVRKTEIPLPPIEVQTEIVRILDKFISLEAKLEAELDCRKRQYEYYRDKLLSFENVEGQEVEWKKIGEICDTLSGFPFDSSKFQTSGIKLMRGKNVKRGYFDFNEDDDRYWESPDGLEKYLLQDKDIIISMDGSLVGKSFAMLSKKHLPLLLVQRVARVRAKRVNPNFLFHNIAHRFSGYVDKKKTGGAIPHVSMKDIQNFSIPVPSLQEQERITTILDRFESLTTSLQSGLPAEISARRQQYEHYRDKLLTFKRKGAA